MKAVAVNGDLVIQVQGHGRVGCQDYPVELCAVFAGIVTYSVLLGSGMVIDHAVLTADQIAEIQHVVTGAAASDQKLRLVDGELNREGRIPACKLDGGHKIFFA